MRKPKQSTAKMPTYAHITGVAAGTCGRCEHAQDSTNGYSTWYWCRKAVEFARINGSGKPIDPHTVGCKYWELKL